MFYEYYKLSQILATNDTMYLKGQATMAKMQKECHEIMENDVAIIKGIHNRLSQIIHPKSYLSSIHSSALTKYNESSAQASISFVPLS